VIALATALGACETVDKVQAGPDLAPAAAAPKPAGKVDIKVLSSRFYLVSGGDALVEIKASEGAMASDLKVYLNGRDLVTPLKFDQPSNTLRGVVTGLDNGGNWLQVVKADGSSVSQPLVNYPASGPILSGAQIKPFECRTKEAGLGDPLDDNCTIATRYDYFYKSTGTPAAGANGQPGSAFKPLADKSVKPADVATATTIDGRTVPYIVRVETGTSDRFIYRIAVLDDPATPAVGDGWNNRLAMTFGGGCGTNYNQGSSAANGVLSDLYLSRGFAYATSSGLANQLHCNGVLQGETAMMLKERFIEGYGVPKWTVGTGGSGGAIQQLLITEMYPGVLDGLQPSLAFPDSALHTADCGLFENFWKSKEGKGKNWTADKKAAVTGFFGTTCASWARSFVPILDATNVKGCGLNDAALIYDKKKNPKGARCTITDQRVNIYGRDPKTGFARKPDDNVGIQYGLAALNGKTISVDEFLTLNDKIGGNDIDGAFIKTRSVGDPDALRAIYASGLMNSGGGGLKNVPILDYRAYSDSVNDIHSRERDLTIRARLEKANGRSDNQVIWVAGPRGRPGAAAGANVDLAALALDSMTKWLDAMAADPAPLSADKVVKHKPAEAVDAFWTTEGKKVAEKASWDPNTEWNKAWPIHSEPRIVAGQGPANDIMKCQLKPVDMADYKVKFSAAQQKKLKAIFKGGVCDYSKPGVGQVPLAGTYVKY
jgi:hypothetical protein